MKKSNTTDVDDKQLFVQEQDLLSLPLFDFNKCAKRKNEISKNDYDPIKHKRIKEFSFIQELENETLLNKISIEYSNYPDAFCFDLWNAFMYFGYSNFQQSGVFPEYLNYNFTEIAKFMKRNPDGRFYHDVKEAIELLNTTRIKVEQKSIIDENKNKKFKEMVFYLISSYGFKGEKSSQGITVDQSFIRIEPLIAENLSRQFFIVFDLLTYQNLDTALSKALYMRLKPKLFYVQRNNKDYYSKNYNDICNYWLLLKPQKYKSTINQQLSEHLNILKLNNVIGDYFLYKGTENEWIINFYIPNKKINFQKEIRKQKEIDCFIKEVNKTIQSFKKEDKNKFNELEQIVKTKIKNRGFIEENHPNVYGVMYNEELYKMICTEKGTTPKELNL